MQQLNAIQTTDYLKLIIWLLGNLSNMPRTGIDFIFWNVALIFTAVYNSLILSMNCDLLLTNKIWQRWWAVSPYFMLYEIKSR